VPRNHANKNTLLRKFILMILARVVRARNLKNAAEDMTNYM